VVHQDDRAFLGPDLVNGLLWLLDLNEFLSGSIQSGWEELGRVNLVQLLYALVSLRGMVNILLVAA